MRRRLVAALVLAVGCGGAFVPAVRAEHGGPPVGSLLSCDRPVNPPRCVSVGNDRWHYVYIDGSVPPQLAEAVRRAIADYDSTALVVREQERLTTVTDVTVYAGNHGTNGAAGWVNCPAAARQGVNDSGDRWCMGQELHFNLNARYAAYFADDASRQYMACHELGHSVGLRHWGNPPRSDGPAAATCMQPDASDGPTTLHQFDRDHMDAYYAHSRGAPLEAIGRWLRHLPVAADLGNHLLDDGWQEWLSSASGAR